MEKNTKAGLLIGGATTAAIVATLLRGKTSQAAPTQEMPIDDAEAAALASILLNIQDMGQDIRAMVEAIDGLTLAIGRSIGTGSAAGALVGLQNPDTIVCFRLYPPAVGTAISVPEYIVPWDHEFVIKALQTNIGVAYVGNSQAEAQNINSSYPLIANEAIGYKIHNTKQLWVACNIAGEGVVCTVEQKGAR